MAGAEVSALVGVAGLQQHRMSLRPGGQRRDSAHVELRPVMFDGPDAAGIDVDSGVDVGQHGIGCPAVPELARHGEELLGPRVAVGVVEKAAAPEVLAGEGVRRRDDVPAGTTVGEMVECRELPCHLEGFVEGGVDGPGQPDPVGDARQRGQHGEGVRAAHHVEVVDPATMLPQSQPFGQEEEVEQSALGGAGQVHERVELDLAARAGIGPHGGVVDAREVGGQGESACGAFLPACSFAEPPPLWRSVRASAAGRRGRWVTEVTTSSSAPVSRCSADSRSATSSGSPTNCVSSRSFTTGSCSSGSGGQSSGSG